MHFTNTNLKNVGSTDRKDKIPIALFRKNFNDNPIWNTQAFTNKEVDIQ